jgi:hypothetical protein
MMMSLAVCWCPLHPHLEFVSVAVLLLLGDTDQHARLDTLVDTFLTNGVAPAAMRVLL